MKLVVGLGNPGDRYKYTRHNLGFLVIDELARKLKTDVKKEECHAKTGSTHWRGHSLILAKPQTFMNKSGEAVSALLRYYQIAPEDVLVIYDDLALPPGRLRIRAKGSAGGHNGLRSIIHYLRTEGLPRIRIGIGSVPPGWAGADYVLSTLPRDDVTIHQAIGQAAEAALVWVNEGIGAAMRYNNNAPET